MTRDHATTRRSAGRVVVSLVLGTALVIGSFALAVTGAGYLQSKVNSTTVTKAKTGSDLYRKSLSVKATVLDGPLIPGVTRPLKVVMKNPLGKTLKVTAVSVTVKKPAASGCSKSWVTASSFKANKKHKPITVKPHKTAKVMLKVQLKNLSSVNQDACKNTHIPLKVEATAKPG